MAKHTSPAAALPNTELRLATVKREVADKIGHIDALEIKIAKLDAEGATAQVDDLLQRINDLEHELDELRFKRGNLESIATGQRAAVAVPPVRTAA